MQNISYAIMDITDEKLDGYIDPNFIEYCKTNGIANDIVCGVPADTNFYIEGIKDDKKFTILFLRKSALDLKHSIISLPPDLNYLISNTNILYGYAQVPIHNTSGMFGPVDLIGLLDAFDPVIPLPTFKMHLDIDGRVIIDQYIEFKNEYMRINRNISHKEFSSYYDCFVHSKEYTEYRIFDPFRVPIGVPAPIELYKMSEDKTDFNLHSLVISPWDNITCEQYKAEAELIKLSTSNAVDIMVRWFTDIETL